MYSKKIFLVLGIVATTIFPLALSAQVTIGAKESPAQGAILQLKDEGVYINGQTASKGLGMPRVALVSNSSLKPCLETDVEANDANNKASHIGLCVYNVGAENTASAETQLCKGLHVWNGQKWTPLNPYPAPNYNILECGPGPDFTINCSTISINGSYNYNQTLSSSNTVTVSITSPSSETGKKIVLKGYYEGNSEISFSTDEGITLTGGTQTVTLRGSGTISSYNYKDFVLVSNSSNTTNSNCPFEVRVTLPVLRIVGVGAENYQPASKSVNSRSYSLMSSAAAFGSSSSAVVPTSGFNFVSYQYRSDAEWSALFASKPDIIIRSFDNAMSNNVSAALKTYLEAGGIFIDLNDNNNKSNAGVRALYGTSATSSTDSGGAGPRTIENVNDEIVNGPFSKPLTGSTLAGKTWFEDASLTQGIQNVPLDQIIIYSYSPTNGLVVAFRDKKLNYFYIGDGGFLSGYLRAETCCYPFQVDSNNMPIAAYDVYDVNQVRNRYNSYFFANIMAWALRQATTNGINYSNGIPK
ncbi:hypothetical protein [Dysgonomonas sp. ZJ709]|uniref:hypothetical protein n=1 Tax=Dysgonomonas sp. ZJ709 TaxID=2709797 RepID=UPI0013EBEE2B|nr:hypothetical protein [Dysgonomonas sp. ZJ709]